MPAVVYRPTRCASLKISSTSAVEQNGLPSLRRPASEARSTGPRLGRRMTAGRSVGVVSTGGWFDWCALPSRPRTVFAFGEALGGLVW